MSERIIKLIKKIFSIPEISDNPSCYIYDLKDIKKKIKKIELYAPQNISL